LLAVPGYTFAALSAEEAAKLGGPNLTVFGAEKAGNKDGTIPPYTGGITKGSDGWYYEGKLKVPSSKFDPAKQTQRPDPFADDKPLFTITAQNMSQYADKLTPGTQELFKVFNGYKMHVYPTRRSVNYRPEVVDGTKKSAVTAKLEKNGTHLTGARCGIPFPLTKNGLEAVWNHLVRWVGTTELGKYESYVINAAGRAIRTSLGIYRLEYPYWDPKHPMGDTLCIIRDEVLAPPNRAGEGLLWKFMIDQSKGNPAWQYLPGQRRVKLAPEIAYDGPNTSVAGAATYDESYGYNGAPDRFEWTLLGKKEIYIPYNVYRLQYHSKGRDVMTPQFVNPDYVRWELHRVYVVEGKLKPQFRHIFKRRVMYMDEDTWYVMVHDEFDHKDQVYRVVNTAQVFNYDHNAQWTCGYWGYDLIAGIYYFNAYTGDEGTGPRYVPSLPPAELSPAALAGAGIR
jgi:hypothetical protein